MDGCNQKYLQAELTNDIKIGNKSYVKALNKRLGSCDDDEGNV